MKLNRNFGVEIEFSDKFEKVYKILDKIIPKKERKFKEKHFFSDGNTWDLKTDATTEIELATPILTFKSPKYKLFKKIINTLKENKIKSTKIRDSIHVHIQCDDIHDKQILIGWLYIENGIKKLFPKLRMRNKRRKGNNEDYCTRYIKQVSYDKQICDYFKDANNIMDDHHNILSFQNYIYNGTIEFRSHEGCLEFKEIELWIKFCMYFLNFCKKIDPLEFLTNDVLSNSLYLSEELLLPNYLKDWVNNRELMNV